MFILQLNGEAKLTTHLLHGHRDRFETFKNLSRDDYLKINTSVRCEDGGALRRKTLFSNHKVAGWHLGDLANEEALFFHNYYPFRIRREPCHFTSPDGRGVRVIEIGHEISRGINNYIDRDPRTRSAVKDEICASRDYTCAFRRFMGLIDFRASVTTQYPSVILRDTVCRERVRMVGDVKNEKQLSLVNLTVA
ncbi:hypothetical protein EVAR_18881_1 [Eumeta japonica]|uniref:Uncharacterized protein n=1 Tax=Eumeta variegata TaxID=151549 RepID=A0A4C1V2J0_EUMVA|nr:hypothetical protein EVAR_18881_1 [Eumeta japonica]